jgi:DNA-binding MarR family transcriptional regulator
MKGESFRGKDLARLSGQSKQVVGVIIDDLEKLGYVKRKPDRADRRAKLVVPTARDSARWMARTRSWPTS